MRLSKPAAPGEEAEAEEVVPVVETDDECEQECDKANKEWKIKILRKIGTKQVDEDEMHALGSMVNEMKVRCMARRKGFGKLVQQNMIGPERGSS